MREYPAPGGRVTLLGLGRCGSGSEVRRCDLGGRNISVDAAHHQITLKHDAVSGSTGAMTMPFRVKDPAILEVRAQGNLVTATLVVTNTEALLATLRKVEYAELAPLQPAPAASWAFELLADLTPALESS